MKLALKPQTPNVKQFEVGSLGFDYQRSLTLTRYISFVMKSVFSSADNAQFDAASGSLIFPSRSPSELKIQMPPGPEAKTFPRLSTLSPSGSPFACSGAPIALSKILPLVKLSSGPRSNAYQFGFWGSELETINVFSPGRKAIPFGLVSVSVMS